MLEPWLAVGLWAGLILLASTRYLSFEKTARPFVELSHRLFPKAPVRRLSSWHLYGRKLAHWVGYFVLTLLVAGALEHQLPRVARHWQLALALLSTTLFAAIDEMHQAYVPTRVGSLADVAIDACGGLCAILFLLALDLQSVAD